MAETLTKQVSELLNEEKWTRATLNSYSINNFIELDEIIRETRKSEKDDEVLDLCEEHLRHTRNSIVGLYLSGIISLGKQLVDDSNLVALVNIFTDNHKWNIVEYLCSRMLEYGESKFALRTLAEVYENENEQDKKYAIWERYIKVDYEEAEIVKLLAEKKEQEGDTESAIDYFKKALHRFINKKMFANVKEVWEKLIEYAPEDVEFFFSIERKIVKVLSGERAAQLLGYLVPHFKSSGEWDTAIEILKRVLTYEPKNSDARKEIVECFRQKYTGHSQLEEYLRISNLNQSWRNVHDAIADFEKHISFDVGNYVYHSSWKIGQIVDIQNDGIVIDFASKPGHRMSLKMAVGALKILSQDHIWVLIHTTPKEELRRRVKEDPVWALKTVIKSFDNQADMKMVKEQLVPKVLTAGEWSKWSTEARKILKTNPIFGNVPEKLDRYTVRDKPISLEEKIFNKFKAEKHFFDRVQTVREFLEHEEPDSDFFAEMFGYFVGFAKAYASVTEHTVASYLLVQEIVNVYPYLNPGLDYTFADLLAQVDDVEGLFGRIADSELKKSFLVQLKAHHRDWPSVYARLFLGYNSKFIIDELAREKETEILKGLLNQITSRYREYREAFVWVARNLLDEPWVKDMQLRLEKVLIGMIHLLDITFREINDKRDVSHNRKINRQIQDFLFKEQRLLGYIQATGEESIRRLYTLLDEVKELDPSIKIGLKQQIKERFPAYQFRGDQEKETVSLGLMVTRKSYEEKQRELRNILETEIPQNSQEIGQAMSKGDLRENAEYKAALEKQELLKSAASRLQEELQRAQIFDESQVVTDQISFGTLVRLENLDTQTPEQYVILGPWESNPAKNVISYRSPLGAELLNHTVGQELEFNVGEKRFRYRVAEIARAEVE
ncbi:MAG: transcription elongation factor GreA [Spirochaetales bacterium]|nr:transcription elongation factor GreA [Spirochaetales bacterium]